MRRGILQAGRSTIKNEDKQIQHVLEIFLTSFLLLAYQTENPQNCR